MNENTLTETGKRQFTDSEGSPLTDRGHVQAQDGQGKPLSDIGAKQRNDGANFDPANAPNSSRVEKMLGYSSGGLMPWAAKGVNSPMQRAEPHMKPDTAEILDRHANAKPPEMERAAVAPTETTPPPIRMAAGADGEDVERHEPESGLHSRCMSRKGEPPVEVLHEPAPTAEENREFKEDWEEHEPPVDPDVEQEYLPSPGLEGKPAEDEHPVLKAQRLKLLAKVKTAIKEGSFGSDLAHLIPKSARTGEQAMQALADLAAKLEAESRHTGVVDPGREMGQGPGGKDAPGFESNEINNDDPTGNLPVVRGEGPMDSKTRNLPSLVPPGCRDVDAGRFAYQGNSKPPSEAKVDWGKGGNDGHGNRTNNK